MRTFGAAGSEWLEALPVRLDHYVAVWDLTVDLADRLEPWYGVCGIVVPVRMPDGAPAVLKVSVQDEENAQEHLALATWRGRGAARLLAADGPGRALLLARLAVPAPAGIPTVADVAARWVVDLPQRWDALGVGAPRALLDRAVEVAGVDVERAAMWTIAREIANLVWYVEHGMATQARRSTWVAAALA